MDIEKSNLEVLEDDLCGSLYYLRSAISKLSASTVRNYLLRDMTRVIEFKNIDDLYRLHGNIFRIVDTVIQAKLDVKILWLAENILDDINEIIGRIQGEYRENNYGYWRI